MQAKGKRHTRQRQTLIEVFFAAGGHLTLQEVLVLAQASEPGIGIATVYRTMKLLVAAGVATEHRFSEGQSRYELADLAGEHHDHMICTICGHIFEFEDPLIEERQQRVADRYGLSIRSHRHEIYGECKQPASCQHNRG